MKAALASGALSSACASARGSRSATPSLRRRIRARRSSGYRRTAPGRQRSRRANYVAATILVPSGAAREHSVWLPCVAPLVRKNDRAAPNASAASRSASTYRVGVGPMSTPQGQRHIGRERVDAGRLDQRGIRTGTTLVTGRVAVAGRAADAYATTTSRYTVRSAVREPSSATHLLGRFLCGRPRYHDHRYRAVLASWWPATR